jgi:hypothetical protein
MVAPIIDPVQARDRELESSFILDIADQLPQCRMDKLKLFVVYSHVRI